MKLHEIFNNNSKLFEMRKNVAPGRYGEMEMFELTSKRDILGLIKRFGGFRAMLHDTYMNGWDGSDYTHGDYEEHWGSGHHLFITKRGDGFEIQIMPDDTSPFYVRNNPAFKKVFGNSEVHFIDAETDEPIPELNESKNEAEHLEILKKTGFFGSRAGGCLFVAEDTGRILLGKRSQDVQEPGDYGTFGGAFDKNESPEEAIRREVREETDYTADFKLIPLFVFRAPSFEYHNFMAIVPTEFKPKLDWENESALWFDYGDWPEPLHFGMKALLRDKVSQAAIKKASQVSPALNHATYFTLS